MASRSYRRRYYSRRKQFGSSFNTETILVGALIILSLFFALYIGIEFENAIYAVFLLLLSIVLIVTVVGIVVLYKRHQEERSLELSQVMTMSGIEFENYLVGLLTFKGFTNVKVTPPSGDYGVDLIGYRNSVKVAFQAKQYNTWKKVGLDAVQQVVAGLKHYRCTESMVVTTGRFTRQAEQLAYANQTELIDHDTLKVWINEYRQSTSPSLWDLVKSFVQKKAL